jgi:hypothetical protein
MTENLVENVIQDFCKEFLDYPYLCRTEHCLHARFYHQMLIKLSFDNGYARFRGQRICIVQKEYPTGGRLDSDRRSNWDIAIIDVPVSSMPNREETLENLKLNTAIEFGLNADRAHLERDIQRLCHEDNDKILKKRFIMHFYRISKTISMRDWSPQAERFLNEEDIQNLLQNNFRGQNLVVYYAKSGDDKICKGPHEPCIWRITSAKNVKIA